MKPVVDINACIGCGTCESICPNVFKIQAITEMGGSMKAVVQEADYAADKDKIDQSIGACPVQAISWGE